MGGINAATDSLTREPPDWYIKDPKTDQMVLVELDSSRQQILLHAVIITYGDASDTAITRQIAEEIEDMWNEPRGQVLLGGKMLQVRFKVSPRWYPDIRPEQIFQNRDPRLNLFRIEAYAMGNISFVDGLGSNTGYFKLENLYAGSTTAAHEFGHGLGLDHPELLDIRGQGRPGIMYPRGTWVDPEFQYDSTAAPGAPGGTMHPMHRRVLAADIGMLQLDRLRFREGWAVLGAMTNIFHQPHEERDNEQFVGP